MTIEINHSTDIKINHSTESICADCESKSKKTDIPKGKKWCHDCLSKRQKNRRTLIGLGATLLLIGILVLFYLLNVEQLGIVPSKDLPPLLNWVIPIYYHIMDVANNPLSLQNIIQGSLIIFIIIGFLYFTWVSDSRLSHKNRI